MQDIEAAEYNWCITKDKFGAVYFLNSRALSIYNSINGSVSYINLRNLGFRQSITEKPKES